MTNVQAQDITIKLKECEAQRDKLQQGYRAVLACIDKMEQLTQFQDKIDMPSSSIAQIWDIFLEEVRNVINTEVCSLFLVDEESHEFVLQRVSPEEQGAVCREEVSSQIEYGMFSWIIRRKKPAVVPSLVSKRKKLSSCFPCARLEERMEWC